MSRILLENLRRYRSIAPASKAMKPLGGFLMCRCELAAGARPRLTPAVPARSASNDRRFLPNTPSPGSPPAGEVANDGPNKYKPVFALCLQHSTTHPFFRFCICIHRFEQLRHHLLATIASNSNTRYPSIPCYRYCFSLTFATTPWLFLERQLAGILGRPWASILVLNCHTYPQP
jgi:hypothetical protein